MGEDMGVFTAPIFRHFSLPRRGRAGVGTGYGDVGIAYGGGHRSRLDPCQERRPRPQRFHLRPPAHIIRRPAQAGYEQTNLLAKNHHLLHNEGKHGKENSSHR